MRRRLLVVDDNAGYRRLVRTALDEDPAFEVVGEAASSAAAVPVAVAVRPDVALVDVLLPGGAGFRLPSELREAVPGCSVVLSSAHPDGDLDAMRQLGSIAFLPKSLPPGDLGRELVTLLDDLSQALDVRRESSTSLASSRDSPRAARRVVERVLGSWGCDEALVDIVTLLVSELVGNAVVHAVSDVELWIRLLADRLRVDVIDRSTVVPHRRSAGADDQTGRGSVLVERLATSWGITGRPDGKSVWFEVAITPAADGALFATAPGQEPGR
jgi:DNA-binding NarL/FixJ family response regulator